MKTNASQTLMPSRLKPGTAFEIYPVSAMGQFGKRNNAAAGHSLLPNGKHAFALPERDRMVDRALRHHESLHAHHTTANWIKLLKELCTSLPETLVQSLEDIRVHALDSLTQKGANPTDCHAIKATQKDILTLTALNVRNTKRAARKLKQLAADPKMVVFPSPVVGMDILRSGVLIALASPSNPKEALSLGLSLHKTGSDIRAIDHSVLGETPSKIARGITWNEVDRRVMEWIGSRKALTNKRKFLELAKFIGKLFEPEEPIIKGGQPGTQVLDSDEATLIFETAIPKRFDSVASGLVEFARERDIALPQASGKLTPTKSAIQILIHRKLGIARTKLVRKGWIDSSEPDIVSTTQAKGTVLIDISGSMSLSAAILDSVLASLPLATVAGYNGFAVRANPSLTKMEVLGLLIVLAQNGRRLSAQQLDRINDAGQLRRAIKDQDIDSLKQLIQSHQTLGLPIVPLTPSLRSMPNFATLPGIPCDVGNGNACDGPAIEWLTKNQGPRILISDGCWNGPQASVNLASDLTDWFGSVISSSIQPIPQKTISSNHGFLWFKSMEIALSWLAHNLPKP